MKKEDARAILVAEWLALPRHQRETEVQAIAFANAHEYDYTFKTTGGRANTIFRWLKNHLPEGEARRPSKIRRSRGQPPPA